MGGHGVMGNEPESLDYSVHEAWNEATNVYLLVILVSFGLLMYARKNKRKIMRIFALPPSVGSTPEPNFYDSLQKVRLRQQLEMYSLARKFEHQQQHQQQQQQQQQGQTESVQLSME
ncbi:small integral membrane protein 19 [Polymixia lowei]